MIQLFRERLFNWQVSKHTQQCRMVQCIMQSRSNVLAERLPERPILGFFENVPHYLSALSRMYTCFGQPFRNITVTTYVFGFSEIEYSLSRKVSQVVLQAIPKTRTRFKNHTSNGFLHLEMVINNLPAYLSAIPDAFLLFWEVYLDNF